MITVEGIFLIQYIWEFIENKITIEKNSLLEQFILFFDQTDTDSTNLLVDYYFVFILYLYYLQFQIYNTKNYSKFISDDYNINNYLQINLKNYPKIKKVIFYLLKLIKEFYIWLLLFLMFYFITGFDITIMFIIKLVMFSIVLFYLLTIKESHRRLVQVVRLLIIYCFIITMICYFYQFTIFDLVKENLTFLDISRYPDFVKMNLKVEFEGDLGRILSKRKFSV